MPGPNPEPPPPTYADVLHDEAARAREAADAELDRARLEHARLIRDAANDAYREAQARALAAARGGEEVLSPRTELDDTYLDALEVAITPPNGPLVTRIMRFAESPPGEDPTPPDVLGRIALWKVDVRGDDVQLLIAEVRRLRVVVAELVRHAPTYGITPAPGETDVDLALRFVGVILGHVDPADPPPPPVAQGWWHPSVKSGQVHDHTAVQPQTMHRLCRQIALIPEDRS
jgi:hypothetical protein